MVKKSGKRSYYAYAEFWYFFCLDFSVSEYAFVMFRNVIAGTICTNGDNKCHPKQRGFPRWIYDKYTGF